MKFKYPFRSEQCCFDVSLSSDLQGVTCPDFGAMVSYGATGNRDLVPGEVRLAVGADGDRLKCAAVFPKLERHRGTIAAGDFCFHVTPPAALDCTRGAGRMANGASIVLRHVLGPICAGAFSEECTYVDWDDVACWLKSNADLLLGYGLGNSIESAYSSARESLNDYLDVHPDAGVFVVGYWPSSISFPDGLRRIRAAWRDRIVLVGSPAVEGGTVAVSLLVTVGGSLAADEIPICR